MPQLKIDNALIDELVKRQVAEQPPKLDLDLPKITSGGELNPTLLSILGSLADGVSTYNFMRQGGLEDNSLYQSLSGSPIGTGLAVAGTGLAELGLSRLLGKKFPGLAKTLLANQAAQRIGLAGENFAQPTNRKESSIDSYNRAVTREISKE